MADSNPGAQPNQAVKNYIVIGNRIYFAVRNDKEWENYIGKHNRYHFSYPAEFPLLAWTEIVDIPNGFDYLEDYLYREDVERLVRQLQETL